MVMDYIYPCFIAFAASFVFCFILNVKDLRIAFVASIGAALGWLVYLVAGNYFGVAGKCLLAAITAALYAEIIARKLKNPATVFIIVGILPLVPGGGIYYTMEYCIQGNNEMFLLKGMETLAAAGAIAVGVSFAAAFYRIYIQTKSFVLNKIIKRG